MTDAPITFDATVNKVQTLVDQGLRVSFDLPENAIVAAAQLMALKREGVVLRVTIDAAPIASGREDGAAKMITRKSSRGA